MLFLLFAVWVAPAALAGLGLWVWLRGEKDSRALWLDGEEEETRITIERCRG